MLSKPEKLCKECNKNPPHPWRRFCLSCIQKKDREKQKERKAKQASRVKSQKAKAIDKKRFSRSALIREADRVHSLYTRWRDRGKPCITCNTPWQDNFQCWHFMSRRHLNTRWLPTNAHGQCPKCNLYGAGEQYAHAQAIDILYGSNTAQSIQKLANMSDKTTDSEEERRKARSKTFTGIAEAMASQWGIVIRSRNVAACL